MEILYQDNHLLALGKPAGLLTQPTDKEPDSLETRAKQWIKENTGKAGNVFLHAVHRLDKPASGIVLFARTSKALERLNESMRNKECQKHYLALIENKPPQEKGILEHHLLHDDYRATVDPKGKLARLAYQIVRQAPHGFLIAIELETGRYHQIRAQFAAIGCPIFGDSKYGSRIPFDGIALHHDKLSIRHPTTKEMITFTCPLPAGWNLP